MDMTLNQAIAILCEAQDIEEQLDQELRALKGLNPLGHRGDRCYTCFKTVLNELKKTEEKILILQSEIKNIKENNFIEEKTVIANIALRLGIDIEKKNQREF